MKNLMAGFAAIVLIACAVVLFQQRQAQEKLRAENGSLQQQIAKLKADNENLSNLAAQAKSSQSLPDEQFTELLKLRGEVGVLHQQLESQKAQTTQLIQEVQKSAPLQKAKTVPPAPSAFISKDQLTNAGFETPEATLQTYFHGIFSDNFDQVVSSMSAQIPAAALNDPRDREAFENDFRKDGTSLQGIQTIAKKAINDNEVELEVMVFQQGKTPDTTIERMLKEGGRWKFAGSIGVSSSWGNDGQVQPITPNQ